MATNTAKYLSYAEAWRRIKAATAQGFHFEVVTLCESIISDRLLSYVRGFNPSSKANVRTQFASLISEWRKLAVRDLPPYGASDLGAAVNTWREERNAVVHSLTKSEPGTPTSQLQSFITRAEQAAKAGEGLARAVSNWHKRRLVSHRKKQAAHAMAKNVTSPSLK